MNPDTAADFIDSFESFYQTYYRDEIGRLVQRYPKDQRSLEVSWSDIHRHDPELADVVLNNPAEFSDVLDEALHDIDISVDMDLSRASVRLVDLPDDVSYGVGQYRTSNRGDLLSITGQVSRRTQVKPIATEIAFECQRCGTLTRVPQPGDDVVEPHECHGCERQGPFQENLDKSTLRDYQLIRVQQPPEQATGGNGETVDVELTGDLTGTVEAGDRIDVNGILEARQESDEKPVYEYCVDGQAIEPKETSYEAIEIEPYIEDIREIANSDDPHQQLVNSFAPGIYGYEEQKLAIILQMFGGVRSTYPGGDADRGSIHILMLGDPGTAKSSLLRAASELSPRSAFASGKGSSAAGLTAGINADDFGHERYSLEAGVMVEANEGLACIDELDKVDEEVRSSLHTALEQQVVEVSKIIQASMPARTSLLAAGNPRWGRFDPYEPLSDQITLGPAMLSRFDLMFLIRDEPDPTTDRELSEHIINMKDQATRYTHDGADASENIDPDLEPELIRAYIAYARQYVHPRFDSEEPKQALQDFYISLRESSYDDEDAPIPVTARKLEAGIRLAEASARIRLSESITMEDVERAKLLVMSSLKDVGVDPETDEMDVDVVATGSSKSQKERIKLLKTIVNEIASEHSGGAPLDEIYARAAEEGIERSKAEHTIENARDQGHMYEPTEGRLRTV